MKRYQPGMSETNIANVDLNLLVALGWLLKERSATRAAKRLHISQSAVSHRLRHLRVLFDDPLFVVTPDGLEPTPFAETLHAPVRSVLDAVGDLLAHRIDFDPATAKRTFRIIGASYGEIVFGPEILAELNTRAPGINVHMLRPSRDRLGDLERGVGDLLLSAGPLPPRQGLKSAFLLDDPFASAVRRDHPVVRASLSLKRFVTLPHLLISPTGEGPGAVDTALAERGLSRRIAARTSDFVAAPFIVSRTDMVLTAPRKLLESVAEPLGLRVFPCPVELGAVPIYMVWPGRSDADPAHRFVREIVARVMAGTVSV